MHTRAQPPNCKARPMVTANLDCALVSELDINNTKTDLAMVLPDSGWAEFKALGSKESSATANAFDKMKHRVQSLTDPGGVNNYKIQRVQVDPGSEFRGDFEAACARDNIVLTRGGVGQKSAGAYVEGFIGTIHPLASAMAKNALICEDLAIMLRGELREHAAEVKLHTKKSSGFSTFEEQAKQSGVSEKWLEDTATFGRLNFWIRSQEDTPQ